MFKTTTLASWTEDTTASQSLISTNGGVETIEVTLTGGAPADTKLFVRLAAE